MAKSGQVNPPPIFMPLAEDDGKATPQWTIFFNSIFNGDSGTVWTPLFTNLTTVGSPTITGNIYRIGRSLCYFSVTITPSTSTTSVAGTTYISNFPLKMSANGACIAVSGLVGGTPGMCDEASNNIYVPAWTTVTVPLTIVGIMEAN